VVHQEEQLSIVLLCEVAEIRRAAFYKWRKHQPSQRQLENEGLVESIRFLHSQVNGIYGYRRITLTINRERATNNQPVINEKRIYRLMRLFGIQAVIRRKRKKYKKSPADHVAKNILNREFTAEKPNQKWCTDVTEFKYGNGQKTYLSAIIDLHDGSIVDYTIGKSNNNPLVFKNVKAAIRQLKPGETPLIHSDRGYQYTSGKFKTILKTPKMTHSMSRVGRCIDNSPIESFWGKLKGEMYYLKKFETYGELKKAIEVYIDFYNNKRYQKRLNGLSPLEFRSQAA
jgi:transposase InsO family protein